MRNVPYVINDEQFEVILKHLSSKNRLAAELMYFCGLRVSEVVKLKPADIDLKRRRLFIEKSKNLKNRYVPIHPKLLVKLRDFETLKTNRKNIYAAIKRISIKFRWPISPHTLRHSYATHLVDRGMSIIEVQYLMGHSDISTTQVYLHTSLDKTQEHYEELIANKEKQK